MSGTMRTRTSIARPSRGRRHSPRCADVLTLAHAALTFAAIRWSSPRPDSQAENAGSIPVARSNQTNAKPGRALLVIDCSVGALDLVAVGVVGDDLNEPGVRVALLDRMT